MTYATRDTYYISMGMDVPIFRVCLEQNWWACVCMCLKGVNVKTLRRDSNIPVWEKVNTCLERIGEF